MKRLPASFLNFVAELVPKTSSSFSVSHSSCLLAFSNIVPKKSKDVTSAVSVISELGGIYDKSIIGLVHILAVARPMTKTETL